MVIIRARLLLCPVTVVQVLASEAGEELERWLDGGGDDDNVEVSGAGVSFIRICFCFRFCFFPSIFPRPLLFLPHARRVFRHAAGGDAVRYGSRY